MTLVQLALHQQQRRTVRTQTEKLLHGLGADCLLRADVVRPRGNAFAEIDRGLDVERGQILRCDRKRAAYQPRCDLVSCLVLLRPLTRASPIDVGAKREIACIQGFVRLGANALHFRDKGAVDQVVDGVARIGVPLRRRTPRRND